MQKKEFVLTVDSGGSKTKLALYDGAGAYVKEGVAPSFVKPMEDESVNEVFLDSLKSFCGDCVPYYVVCNIGGKNKKQFALTVKAAFPDTQVKVVRESEGDVAFALCEKYGAQVTLMVGTGSIAVAPAENGAVICCGWGANVSDKGSGYQLGLDALRLVFEEIDGVEPCSMITKTLTGFEMPPKTMTAAEYSDLRDEIRKKLYPFERTHIATFAKVVYACAEAGDEKALALYEKTGVDLADIVLAAVAKTGADLKRVVVTGGMTRAKAFWKDAFERRIREKFNFEEIYYLADGADVGLRALAVMKKEN